MCIPAVVAALAASSMDRSALCRRSSISLVCNCSSRRASSTSSVLVASTDDSCSSSCCCSLTAARRDDSASSFNCSTVWRSCCNSRSSVSVACSTGDTPALASSIISCGSPSRAAMVSA